MSTDGVYFERNDYASFWLRFFVDVIDFFVFGVVCAVLALALLVVFHPTRTVVNVILAAWSALAVCYFVILKRSSAGTIGFRAGRVKVIGIDGRRAGWFGLIVRLFFGMLGPVNWLMDLQLFDR